MIADIFQFKLDMFMESETKLCIKNISENFNCSMYLKRLRCLSVFLSSSSFIQTNVQCLYWSARRQGIGAKFDPCSCLTTRTVVQWRDFHGWFSWNKTWNITVTLKMMTILPSNALAVERIEREYAQLVVGEARNSGSLLSLASCQSGSQLPLRDADHVSIFL